MEVIFSDRDGLKNVLFDHGNNVMLVQVAVGRQSQWLILAKDYASDMCFIRFRGAGYIAYITIDNQLVWQQVGVGERIILNTVLSEVLEIDSINIVSIDNGVYVVYRMRNISEGKWELRYINPLGERKSRILVASADKFLDYKIFNINEHSLLSYRMKGDKKSRYFNIKINEEKELSVENMEDCDERKKDFEGLKNELDIKGKTLSEYENKVNATEEKLKDYINKYNELTKLTQDIQAEGKRWRELYYRSIDKK